MLWRILLVLLVLFGTVGTPHAQTGMVTFTFDDGALNQYTHGYTVMRKYGLPGTLFVVSGGADAGSDGTEPFYMGWDQIREMSASGWEIGAHAHSIPHPDLTTLSDVELFNELAYSKRRIAEELMVVPKIFASPFGEFTDQVVNEVQLYYLAHFRAWGGSEGYNSLNVENSYDISRYDVSHEHTSEDVCTAITRAGAEGFWLVLMFHQIVDQEPSPYQVSLQTFEDIVRCTQNLQHEGIVRVVNPTQALNLEETM